jgi:hypothetical protein
VIVVIAGLLLVSGPPGLLMLLGTAFPGKFDKVADFPSKITSTLTFKLTIAPDDWPRFVEVSDAFAIKHGLTDRVPASTVSVSDLQFVRYESKKAVLRITRNNVEKSVPGVPLLIDVHEVRGSGVGPELKAAFEKEVIQAGRFGE